MVRARQAYSCGTLGPGLAAVAESEELQMWCGGPVGLECGLQQLLALEHLEKRLMGGSARLLHFEQFFPLQIGSCLKEGLLIAVGQSGRQSRPP